MLKIVSDNYYYVTWLSLYVNNHNFNKVVNSGLSPCAPPASDTLTIHVWVLEEPCFPLCCRWYDNPFMEISAQIQMDGKSGNDSVPSSAPLLPT